MFTSPPELYTALTDLLAVPFAVFFAVKCALLFKKSEKPGTALWCALFIFISVSSALGFVVHFFVFPNDNIKQYLWIPLSLLLCATATTLSAEAVTEFSGGKHTGKIIAVFSVLLFAGFVGMMIGKAAGIKYILVFVFYAIAVVLTGLAFYIIIFVKRKSRHILFYFAGCALQAVGAVFQVTRSVVIDIGTLIDYNSIYHILMIISLFPFYVGCEKYSRSPFTKER